MARAGADVVGINCHFDPFRCLAAVKKMIAAVTEAGLKVRIGALLTSDSYVTNSETLFGLGLTNIFPL